MRSIAIAILVVGLAAVSVTAWLMSDGEIGEGWAMIAFLVLLFGHGDKIK